MTTEPQPSTEQMETVVGVSFDDPYRAQEFATAMRRLAAKEQLVLKDTVVIQGRADGRTVTHESIDPRPARTALSGALWSSLIGLLVAGPVGWAAGAAIGAGAGVVTAKVIDLGLPDEWVEWFRHTTEPNTTTAAFLVSHLRIEALIDEAQRFPGARLVYANLDDATLQRIHDALR